MRTYRTKTGEDHQVRDDGSCISCGKEHKAMCRRKWKHEHVGGDGERQVLVQKKSKKGSWSVLIADDGSICDRFVTPVPVRLFGLPNRQEKEEL